MDLNEKLAARRRDLGIEAEKEKKAERDAIEVESLSHITESSSMQHATTSTAKINGEDVLTKAAINRFTTWNYVNFWGVLALSLGCFSEGAWLAGLIGIIFAFVIRASAISKYKKEIINENNRRKRREAAQENIDQNTAIGNAAEQFNTDAIGDNDLREGEVTDCSLSKEEIEYLEKPIKAIHYVSKYDISEDKLSKAISKGKIRGVLYQDVLWVQDQKI